MNGKKIMGNASKATLPKGNNIAGGVGKATLPNGKKMDDFKKPQSQSFGKNVMNNISSQNNNTNGEDGEGKQKSTADQVGQAAASEALKVALKALPWLKIIPRSFIDKLVDSKLGQAIIEKQLTKMKAMIIFGIVAVILTVVFFLIIIAAIAAVILMPIAWIYETIKSGQDFLNSLGNWFKGNGWCATENECQIDAEKKYNEQLANAVNEYRGSCEINGELITATIFYGQMVSQGNQENENTAGSDSYDRYFDYLDVKEGFGSPRADSQINKLINVYWRGEESNKLDAPDNCASSVVKYRKYLIDTYIDSYYPSAVTSTRSKEQIADEIMRMGNVVLINKAFSTSNYCTSIAVKQTDGTLESMSLEDYVARVVTIENPWYEEDNIESMKAQAIVSRTYALEYTSNCTDPIPNSSSTQEVASVASEIATKAASETSGLVLYQNGNILKVEYDDLAVDHSDSDNYYLKQKGLVIPKSWLDEHVSAAEYAYYNANSIGRGLSIWGSNYLQTQGNTYEQILNTFYSTIEITKLGGLISGGNYSSSIGPAADANELNERRAAYEGNLDIYSSAAGLVSQCPWYAKSRAIEIVYGSDMPEDLKQIAINSLWATNGNGTNWYANPDGTVFTKSTDYTAPQPGSIVSWSSSKSNGCPHEYGHVAIVEQVMEDGTVLLSDSYNAAGVSGSNEWKNIAYRVYQVTLNDINNRTSGTCKYTFNGYVYLLG